MFDIEELCLQIKNAVGKIDSELSGAGASPAVPSVQDLKMVLETAQIVDSRNDKVASAFVNSGSWAADSYLSGKTAIVHETGLSRRSVEAYITRGKFLNRYGIVSSALASNLITTDHVTSLLPLSDDKYIEFFIEDLELLIGTSKTLSAGQFSNVVRHWKNMVDSLLDEPTDEYKAFETRKLFLHELLDGTWFIRGELGTITGKILDKALNDISKKLYDRADAAARGDFSATQRRKVRIAPWRMNKQLMLNSETCSVPGCCTPSNWCDAHHVKHWLHGGETKIENLVLLCRRHHTMVHNDKTFEEKLSNWLHQKAPDLIGAS